MKTAKDVMTANPTFIQSGDELRNCIATFFREHIHFAPVVTPLGEILGLVSELALIKASLRNYLEADKHETVYAHKDILEPVSIVREDDPIDDVVKALMLSPTRRLVVVNRQGGLIGIISPKDILRLLSGEQKNIQDMHQELKEVQLRSVNLSQQLKDLESAMTTYKGVFENSPYMMHSVDSSGKIIMANKRIHQVLGYDPEELIGMPIRNLYPESVYPLAVQSLGEIMNKGFHQTTYSTMLTKTGDKIRVDIGSSALKDKHGKFIGTISISREVKSDNLLRALNGIYDDVNRNADKPDSASETLKTGDSSGKS